MGLRKLLSRQPAAAEDPLERLADLGRLEGEPSSPATGGYPSRQKAPAKPQDGTAGVSLVAVGKKAEPVAEPVPQISVAESKKAEPRRTPLYIWRSQANRNSIFDMEF